MTREEAIEKLRGWYFLDNDEREVLETLIPEIRVSKDEKIRRELIEHIKSNCETGFVLFQKFSPDDILAWLEKQRKQKPYGQREECSNCQFNYAGHCKGYCELKRQDKSTFKQCKQESDRVFESLEISSEKYNEIVNECIFGDDEKNSTQNEEQELTDKPKLKFKEDDWLCANELNNYANIIKIVKIVDVFGKKRYKVSRDYDSDLDLVEFDFIEKYYHLWTINDAKPGDVLVHNSITFIFKGIEDGIVKGICSELSDTISNFGKSEYNNDYCPATKEQRDALFAVMKAEGYKWDAKKKELKKMEQKPKWTKEDKSKVEDIIYFLNIAKTHYASTKAIDDCVEWLESLKRRLQ